MPEPEEREGDLYWSEALEDAQFLHTLNLESQSIFRFEDGWATGLDLLAIFEHFESEHCAKPLGSWPPSTGPPRCSQTS